MGEISRLGLGGAGSGKSVTTVFTLVHQQIVESPTTDYHCVRLRPRVMSDFPRLTDAYQANLHLPICVLAPKAFDEPRFQYVLSDRVVDSKG